MPLRFSWHILRPLLSFQFVRENCKKSTKVKVHLRIVWFSATKHIRTTKHSKRILPHCHGLVHRNLFYLLLRQGSKRFSNLFQIFFLFFSEFAYHPQISLLWSSLPLSTTSLSFGRELYQGLYLLNFIYYMKLLNQLINLVCRWVT